MISKERICEPFVLRHSDIENSNTRSHKSYVEDVERFFEMGGGGCGGSTSGIGPGGKTTCSDWTVCSGEHFDDGSTADDN